MILIQNLAILRILQDLFEISTLENYEKRELTLGDGTYISVHRGRNCIEGYELVVELENTRRLIFIAVVQSPIFIAVKFLASSCGRTVVCKSGSRWNIGAMRETEQIIYDFLSSAKRATQNMPQGKDVRFT